MKKFDQKIILTLCMLAYFVGLHTSPESMAVTATNRPAEEAVEDTDPSPYATRVFEYKPAPGQFINKAPFGIPENADNVLGEPDGSVISLGGFGGFITVGFDQPVRKRPAKPLWRRLHRGR